MDIEQPQHRVDDEIYVMPQFVTFQVSDLDRSRRWYRDAIGCKELAIMPGPRGEPALVHLRRYRYQDILLVPADGPVTPSAQAVLCLAFSGELDELEKLADHARDLGDGSVEGPVETPWFTVEVRLTDPDGHRLTLTARSARQAPREWDAAVRDSAMGADRGSDGR